jgi:ribosomal protein S4E
MPSRKIKEVLAYEKGATAVVVQGRHRGASGQIKEVVAGTSARESLTTIGDFQTLSKYVFIIGKDKAQVEL